MQSLLTSETISVADMSVSMGPAIILDSSACTLLGGVIALTRLHSDDIVDAAWNNGLGVHALIWVCFMLSSICSAAHNLQFGFDGSNEWKTRRDSLIHTLITNPKAKFVTRGVQFGSEPLFDDVLPHSELAAQVISAKARLAGVHIPVTVSELAYGYQERGGAQDVLDAIDFINIHMLPFFSQLATTGALAWPLVEADTDWFIQHGRGKKMYFDEVGLSTYQHYFSFPDRLFQNGWPSVTSPSVQPNSPLAVASVRSEQVRCIYSNVIPTPVDGVISGILRVTR